MWPSILHDVALATESSLTFIATEVFHVPVPALGLGAFIGKNDLRDRNGHNENQQNIEILSLGEINDSCFQVSYSENKEKLTSCITLKR